MGQTKASGPDRERQAQQHAAEEDFPELGAEDLASLDATTKDQYEKAQAAHKQAKDTLKSATDAGKAAHEAADRLRNLHQSIKRRKNGEGQATATDSQKEHVDKIETSETVDFSNADEVDKYIKQTATLRSRAKCSPETEPAAPQQRG